MGKIIECVPNFSEGRRTEVIDAIASAVRSVPGVTLLDVESDANHNRSVLTFVGTPEAVLSAALGCSAKAVELIDLTRHKGEHPRMGAVDVVPFVPLKETTIEECVAIANDFAKEFSTRCEVPVYLYESAAKTAGRRNLADVRHSEFEGLRELIGRDSSKDPDYGPKRVHPTAGATAVGARPILIAYNVNLKTSDLSIAKRVAKLVRERDGGLPAVKALGFELLDRGMVQVSMNLTDFKRTSMEAAFRRVSELANQFGVDVAESQIVGLVPLDAMTGAVVGYLKLAGFRSDQIIESRIYEMGSESNPSTKSQNLLDLSVADFLSKLASKEPVPGGGSASALAGALAAALVVMVCRLTVDKKGYEAVKPRVLEILDLASRLQRTLEGYVNEDAEAFALVAGAYKLPKDSDSDKAARGRAITEALKSATEVPAKTVESAHSVFLLARETSLIGNKNARSDVETSMAMAKAAMGGAMDNVTLNLESLTAEADFCSSVRARLEPLFKDAEG